MEAPIIHINLWNTPDNTLIALANAISADIDSQQEAANKNVLDDWSFHQYVSTIKSHFSQITLELANRGLKVEDLVKYPEFYP